MACTGEKGKPKKPCPCPHTKIFTGIWENPTPSQVEMVRELRDRQGRIPKDRAAWLNFLVERVKKYIKIKYLSDDEVRKFIKMAKPHLFDKPKLEPLPDPDLPLCYSWTQEQVAEWVELIGFPQYKHAFLLNNITGRRLINMDASALNKIGLRLFDDIKTLAVKIREVLDMCRPNIMRAIMRKAPFELYMKQRQFTGKHYDHQTFESWCEKNGYPYRGVLQFNKCALIERPCPVLLHITTELEDAGSDGSLDEAPSVEFNVRHIVVRNRMIDEILNGIMTCVYTDPAERRCYKRTLSDILCSGFQELGIDKKTCGEQMRFVESIANELMVEIERTAEVMQDIEEFKKQLGYDKDKGIISEQNIKELRDLSAEFLDEMYAIAVLLATGQLELDNIFKQSPKLSGFVDGILQEAEEKLNPNVVPTPSISTPEDFVDELICQAKTTVLKKNYPNMDVKWIEATGNIACGYIDHVFSGDCDPGNVYACLVKSPV